MESSLLREDDTSFDDITYLRTFFEIQNYDTNYNTRNAEIYVTVLVSCFLFAFNFSLTRI